MKIKTPKRNLFSKISPLVNTKKKVFLLIIVIIAGFPVLRNRRVYKKRIIPMLKKYTVRLKYVIECKKNPPERLIIDVNHRNFLKLAYSREVGLSQGLMVGTKEYVPAKISYLDKTYKVKMRLKGDWVDHLKTDKWSYRIQLKGDNTIWGMKRFSIQHPVTRNYICEWLFHRALKREDVLSLRYKFIDVVFNGKDLGIYALEEHFEKRLLEYNRRREGPIIKFNEDIYWSDKLATGNFYSDQLFTGLQSMYASDIDAFKMKDILSDSEKFDQFNMAKNLLESFRTDKLPASKVFDINKMAKIFIISELMGAVHGVGNWLNLRFYYNPVTSVLEPIGFDAMAGRKITSNWAVTSIKSPPDTIISKVFSDTEFFAEYIRELERITSVNYLDAFFDQIDNDLKRNLAILYSDYPDYDFSKDVFYQNQAQLRKLLNPPTVLHAYFLRTTDETIELQLGNVQSIPVEITGLMYKNELVGKPLKKEIIPSKVHGKKARYKNISFTLPNSFGTEDFTMSDLTVQCRLLGQDKDRNQNIYPYSFLSEEFIKKDIVRQSANADKFDFVSVDDTAKKVYIKPGHWQLDRDLIFPKGYEVYCTEGTELNLVNSAMILSRSPVNFIGSAEEPILIFSGDSSGQGIAVISAGGKSTLKYVNFDHLGIKPGSPWKLTSPVTFYESDVNISHAKFTNNNSEDALNIINSKFDLTDVYFFQTSADAFDADFTQGQIIDCRFAAIGNDAIDISGSKILIDNVIIENAEDKGLSIGERSEVKVSKLAIYDTEIAIASKDMSEIVISNSRIVDSRIGFAAFQKKSEFGPASITITNSELLRVQLPYLIEHGSEVLNDGVAIESKHDKIEEMLYGAEYGKKSD